MKGLFYCKQAFFDKIEKKAILNNTKGGDFNV